MESSVDASAHRRAPERPLTRRRLLGWSAAGAFSAAAGSLAACSAQDATARTAPSAAARTAPARPARTARTESPPRGRVLFDDVFAGYSLSQRYWNPYICDNDSDGWPWLMQPSVTVPSSAISHQDGFNVAYNLPSAIGVNDGLTLSAYRGTKASGYSWTGSVICSRPTSNNFGSGTVYTPGFTFADALVEVRAKMPDMTGGQWPSIWFLPSPDNHGAEIDLFEGGFLANGSYANRLMAVKLFTSGNEQQFLDCQTDLSADFHTYAMEYRQGSSVKFFFDGSDVYTYTRNVPVGRYFMILSNSMASAHTADWHTQVSEFTPEVNLMRISDVRVTEL